MFQVDISHCKLKTSQRGASLIEVLITMLIVAIGLLGAGGLQLVATRYQQTAQSRGQAINQVMFIAEKIKANASALVAASPPDQASIYLAADGYAAATLAALPADPACGSVISGTAQTACTNMSSAVRDMREWRRSLESLPGGRGSIFSVSSGGITDPVARQIIVMWNEKQDSEVGTASSPNPAATTDTTCPTPRVAGVRCFSMVVTP